jgi:L-amino acid N-acyltransferase YncA
MPPLSSTTAYRYTLEESIYVDASTTGRGFGTALMDALIARCEEGPWRQMIAVVGDGNNNRARCGCIKNMASRLSVSCAAWLQKRRLAGYGDYAAPTQRW